ncbi:MAG TPA: hypothetical protein VGK67_01510 [Myxococcales bacterium]|jgi:hypothetical protein
MRTSENVTPYAAAAELAKPASSPSLPHAGAPVRCVRLDAAGRPVETFSGSCSVLDDGCVVVVADRSVRVGEQVHLTFPVPGRELTDPFQATRSVASFRPGREPEYRLSFELDEDAGVDFGALLGDRVPDLY